MWVCHVFTELCGGGGDCALAEEGEVLYRVSQKEIDKTLADDWRSTKYVFIEFNLMVFFFYLLCWKYQ